MSIQKNPGSQPSRTANERRRYILQTVRREGEVTFEEIRKHFSVGNQSLISDNEFFEELGLEVCLVPRKGKFVRTNPLFWTYEWRREQNGKTKDAIGRLAKKLVWGGPNDKEEVLKALLAANTSGRGKEAANSAREYLQDYWHKKSRILGLDAGSTTSAVAGSLKETDLPDESARIAVMRIVTNCPKIEEEFEEPSVKTEVILVGGALRKETRAHTGLLMEQCLDAWNVRMDIAMVGTTGLVLRKNGDDPHAAEEVVRGFACDSEDEARTKALFLDRASFRCVLIDSSKLEVEHSSAFTFAEFAGLSSRAINVVITDDGKLRDDYVSEKELHGLSEDRARRRRLRKRRIDFLQQIRDAGIAVLEA